MDSIKPCVKHTLYVFAISKNTWPVEIIHSLCVHLSAWPIFKTWEWEMSFLNIPKGKQLNHFHKINLNNYCNNNHKLKKQNEELQIFHKLLYKVTKYKD